MIFRFNADTTFEAEDLDAAFLKLAAHFKAMSEGGDSTLLIDGRMEIRPDPLLYPQDPNQHERT